MPNPKPYYPAQAAITANNDRISSGQLTEGYGATGHNLFSSGHTEAFMEKAVIYKYFDETGRHFLHTYLSIFGGNRSFPVYGTEHGWYEQGRLIKGLTVSSVVSGDGTASLVVAATTTTDTRFRVNDILQSPRNMGFTMIVTAKNDALSPPQYTLQKRDGSNWAAATEMVANDVLGYLGNAAYGEGTGQPEGLKYNPSIVTNKTVIIKETEEATGNALTTKTELVLPNGEMAYASENRMLMFKRFLYAREQQYMFAEETADDSANPSGRGIYYDITDNALATTDYGAALDETDFQNQILAFKAENASTFWLGLAGSSTMGDMQIALKDYVVDGAVGYGSFGINKNLAVGLNIRQYHFNGVTIEGYNYRAFDERNATGYAGAAGATTVDFRNFMLLLNMGENAGSAFVGGSADALNRNTGHQSGGQKVSVPYLSHVYRALGSVDRSLVVGFANGMTGQINSVGGGNYDLPPNFQEYIQKNVSHDEDLDKMYLLSEVGVRMPCVDVAHGYMRKSA